MSLSGKLWTAVKILFFLWMLSTVLSVFLSFDMGSVGPGNIAVIPINGVISTEGSSGLMESYTGSDTIISLLDEAEKSPNIKAIILDINSGGGSGVAADEISQKVKSLNKTTVAVIRDIGASAAYWIASSADKVYANRMSLTGSIGVTGSYLDFSGTLERYNVSYQRYVSGEYKDMGSPFRKATEQEEELFNQMISKMNDFFIDEVSMNRNLERDHVKGLSDGRIFLGIEAQEYGLVDELGTKADAVRYLESALNITAETTEFKEKASWSDLLYGLKIQGIGTFINSNPSLQLR
jgi:protease IV